MGAADFFNPNYQPTADDFPSPLDGYSTGFTTDFGEAFAAAYNRQVHVTAALAAADDMADLEQKQLDKIFEITGKRLSPLFAGALDFSSPNADRQYAILAGLNGDQLTGVRQKAFADAQDQMKLVQQISAENPAILNYDQMLRHLQEQAKALSATQADLQSRSGVTGWLGGMVGSTAGLLFHPERDPTNVASLALGGFGKSVLTRISTEVGAGALGQAVDMMTGAYQNQEVLGQAPASGQLPAHSAPAPRTWQRRPWPEKSKTL